MDNHYCSCKLTVSLGSAVGRMNSPSSWTCSGRSTSTRHTRRRGGRQSRPPGWWRTSRSPGSAKSAQTWAARISSRVTRCVRPRYVFTPLSCSTLVLQSWQTAAHPGGAPASVATPNGVALTHLGAAAVAGDRPAARAVVRWQPEDPLPDRTATGRPSRLRTDDAPRGRSCPAFLSESGPPVRVVVAGGGGDQECQGDNTRDVFQRFCLSSAFHLPSICLPTSADGVLCWKPVWGVVFSLCLLWAP